MTLSPTRPQPAFSSEEWDWLRSEEKKAARAIISIMGGLVLVALVMYTVIACVNLGGP